MKCISARPRMGHEDHATAVPKPLQRNAMMVAPGPGMEPNTGCVVALLPVFALQTPLRRRRPETGTRPTHCEQSTAAPRSWSAHPHRALRRRISNITARSKRTVACGRLFCARRAFAHLRSALLLLRSTAPSVPGQCDRTKEQGARIILLPATVLPLAQLVYNT